MSRVEYAELTWDEQGQPLSTSFNDIYFSRPSGLEESRYIFLAHNQLEQRFATLANSDSFVIGETGFGTGLNFIAAWQLWQQTAAPGAQLHFLSVEKFPLAKQDLHQALQLWPELRPLSEQLLLQYPAILQRGFHRLNFARDRVSLTLVIDDACTGLEQLLESTHPAHSKPRCAIDAWFLDGFAPAKNPEMWRPRLFRLLAQLSHRGTTLATFSAAGVVKRGLQEQGFSIKIVPGYGRKRHMLRATLTQATALPEVADFPVNGFNSPYPVPWWVHAAKPRPDKTALIIGGGIAGCHTAAALARRGWRVTLLEQHSQLASEGSGNPQAALYAKLSHRAETLSDFNLLALQYALRSYEPFWPDNPQPGPTGGERCGVLQLASDDKAARGQEKLSQYFGAQALFRPVSAAEASEISGLALPSSGLFFPAAGWLDPRDLCQQLTRHPNISVRTGVSAASLEPLTAGGWRVRCQLAGGFDTSTRLETGTGIKPGTEAGSGLTTDSWSATNTRTDTAAELVFDSPVVILCTANAIQRFAQTAQLPIKPIRGQLSYVAATAQSGKLKTVICGDGYITPAQQQRHCIGATFDPHNQDLTLSEREHQDNLATLAAQVPSLQASLAAMTIEGGRAALRCTTPDYLPLLGPAPRCDDYLQQYALLRKNARANIPQGGPHWDNLFVNVGYGSRGMAYSPIGAEILAARINAEPTPVGSELEAALHPARFWIRGLIRRQL